MSVGKAFALYSGLRFVLFTVVVAVLYVFGLTQALPLLATGVLLSAILSFFVLRPQREQLAVAIAGRDAERQEQKAAQRAQLDG